MFFARWDQGGPWNSRGIEGTSRWLRRVWSLFSGTHQQTEPVPGPGPGIEEKLRRKVHQTLRQVTRDFESFQFNTIVAALMELSNEMSLAHQKGAYGSPAWVEAREIYLLMLAPVTPHIAEELWALSGRDESVHLQLWPVVDEDAAREDEVTIVVQVNGKLRGRLTLPAGASEETARELALASPGATRFTEGKTIRKVIVVPDRLVNIVAN